MIILGDHIDGSVDLHRFVSSYIASDSAALAWSVPMLHVITISTGQMRMGVFMMGYSRQMDLSS